jgi:ribosomal protein L22
MEKNNKQLEKNEIKEKIESTKLLNSQKPEKKEEIQKEIVKDIKQEIQKDIPTSSETNTIKKKEEAAEKIAEEVAEESEKVIEDIVEKEEDDKVKTSKKKEIAKPVIKKELAIAWGKSLHISKKHGMYICEFIKGKKIDEAVIDLENVLKFKKAVPFKGEIPHRKGKGMMSGRFPIKASKFFINILKALKGNSIVNGLDLDKTIIYSASASWAPRPARKGNRNAKRTHVILESRETKK